jgi:fatty acid desaturase
MTSMDARAILTAGIEPQIARLARPVLPKRLVELIFFPLMWGFTQHGIADAHDPFLASRSMRPNRLVSFLLLHENLHLEHHLFPEIPSYNLAKVHGLIEPRLPRAVVGRSYLAFVGRFIAATFRRQRPGVIGLIGPSGGTS